MAHKFWMQMKTFSLLFFALGLSGATFATPLISAVEAGLDQEIVESFPAGPGEAVVLFKTYLGARKAQSNPDRAKSVSLQIWDTGGRRPIPVVDIDAKQQFNVGRPVKTDDGFQFVLDYGPNRFEIYRYSRVAREVQRVDTTGLLARIETTGGAFEKVILVESGLIVIRADVGVRWASFMANDGRKPVRLEVVAAGGNDILLSIDDAIQVGDRFNLVVAVAADSQPDRSEVRIVGFDRTLTRAAATFSRLDVGQIMSSQSRFLPTEHAFPSVQVVSRASQSSAPIVSLFSLKDRPILVRSFGLLRPEAMRDFTLAGVCRDSYLLAKRAQRDRGGFSDVEFVWVDSRGTESAPFRMPMVEVGSVINMSLVGGGNGILSLVNFSKIEDVRRPNGWYSWGGFRVDALSTKSHCSRLIR